MTNKEMTREQLKQEAAMLSYSKFSTNGSSYMVFATEADKMADLIARQDAIIKLEASISGKEGVGYEHFM